VHARSRAEAARKLNISDRELSVYGCRTHNKEEILIALSKPGTVFYRSPDFSPPFEFEEEK